MKNKIKSREQQKRIAKQQMAVLVTFNKTKTCNVQLIIDRRVAAQLEKMHKNLKNMPLREKKLQSPKPKLFFCHHVSQKLVLQN